MDYIIDFYNEYDDNGRVVFPQFIYDDRRTCSKFHIFIKLIYFFNIFWNIYIKN